MTPIASLGTLSPDSPCELNVFWHDCDALGVNCAQIGVLKQTYEISLRGFLKSQHSVALVSQVRLNAHTETQDHDREINCV